MRKQHWLWLLIGILVLVGAFPLISLLPESSIEKHPVDATANNAFTRQGKPSENRLPSTEPVLNRSEVVAARIAKRRSQYLTEHPWTYPGTGLYNHPVIAFWIEQLKDPDREIADHAFSLFAGISALPLEYIGSEGLGDDGALIKRAAAANYANCEYEWNAITGKEAIADIVEAILPRLSDPDQEEDALNVLNLFTLMIYEDKNADWWLTRYQNSKLSAILAGKKKELWIDFPE